MAASLFAWLFNFVELTCLPAALKALILHSFFLFSYVNALNWRDLFCGGYYSITYLDQAQYVQWSFMTVSAGPLALAAGSLASTE